MDIKVPNIKGKYLLQKSGAERGQHYSQGKHKEDAKGKRIWQILKGCKCPQWEKTKEVGASSGRAGMGCVKLGEHTGGWEGFSCCVTFQQVYSETAFSACI